MPKSSETPGILKSNASATSSIVPPILFIVSHAIMSAAKAKKTPSAPVAKYVPDAFISRMD